MPIDCCIYCGGDDDGTPSHVCRECYRRVISMGRELWFCYNCRDGLHEQCVGVPCDCECEPVQPTEPEYSI